MTANIFTETVPADISGRFFAHEHASFEVVRRAGEVRLWKSETQDQEVDGFVRPGRVRYHVSIGQDVRIALMPRLQAAIDNFDAIVGVAHA